MIRNPKWHSLFRVKDSPILYENIDPIGKEFDTYKVGTVANSTSTMHKLMAKPITLESFEIDDYNPDTTIEFANENDNLSAHWNWQVRGLANLIISHCEDMRQTYLNYINLEKNADTPEHKKLYSEEAYKVWKELVRWLPESWLQMRTVTLTYENLYAMCSPSQRRFHKLNEWSGKKNPEVPNLISMARALPYAQNFIFLDELSK